ncbi:MAG: branched-chain amino acid ABC transporter permease [Candidatus Bathyarchaeia archaeon]
MALTYVYSIYAISWDILGGYCGQGSLGHGFLFGVGAYTSVLLNLHLRLPIFITIPIGVCTALIAGLIVAAPCSRLHGAYLSIGTLAFPIALTGLIVMFGNITGGEYGTMKLGIPDPLAPSRSFIYYYSLIIMLGVTILSWKLTNSRLGLYFRAIREDEVVVRTCGINTAKYKLLAFCISAILAGLAGAIYAHIVKGADTSITSVTFSIQPLIWTIFGGASSIYGAVVGTFILFPIFQYIRTIPKIPPQLMDISQALLLIILILFIPEGIISRIKKKAQGVKLRGK